MIFDEPSRQPLPTDLEFDDVTYAVKKGIAGLAPLGGELFELLTSPLARRRDDWLEDLERRLRDLEKKVERFRFEDLATNDQFVSTTLVATQAALKTHQPEKLDALKNAVVNVALGHESDSDRQQQFLSLLDRFSATHLVLLRFLNNPAEYFRSAGKSVPSIQTFPKLLVYQLIWQAMPELREQVKSPACDHTAASFQFIELVLRDLVGAKLIALEALNETWAVPKFDNNPAPSLVKPLTTHLGEDFLSFITEPAERKP